VASDFYGVSFTERMERARERKHRRPVARLQPRRFSGRNLEAYWRGREDEARLREELDGVAPEFEPSPEAMEFPPVHRDPISGTGLDHDFATCRTPGHRSCAARKAWTTRRRSP
jgi:hypothetical protein